MKGFEISVTGYGCKKHFGTHFGKIGNRKKNHRWVWYI